MFQPSRTVIKLKPDNVPASRTVIKLKPGNVPALQDCNKTQTWQCSSLQDCTKTQTWQCSSLQDCNKTQTWQCSSLQDCNKLKPGNFPALQDCNIPESKYLVAMLGQDILYQLDKLHTTQHLCACLCILSVKFQASQLSLYNINKYKSSLIVLRAQVNLIGKMDTR